jgi:hypothetical protein
MMESMVVKKGSINLTDGFEIWLSCRNRQNSAIVRCGATFWRIETGGPGFYEGARRAKLFSVRGR